MAGSTCVYGAGDEYIDIRPCQSGNPAYLTMCRPLRAYVVHWNAPDWATSSTASILASDIAVEVVVVDNGPAAASTALDLDPRVRVIRSRVNVGYAGGANLGISEWLAETSDTYCVIAAHDLHIARTGLRSLVQVADRHPAFGILGPNAGACGDLLSVDGDIETRTWVSGTCMLLRRECIETIGPFDETFHSYTEDRDLGLRATAAGFAVGRVRTVAAHGLGSRSPEVELLMRTNRVLLAGKQRGWPGVARQCVGYLHVMVRSIFASLTSRAEHRRAMRRRASTHGRAAIAGLRKYHASRRTPTAP